MSGTLGLNYEIGNITSHEKDTMFLTGLKVMCCRISKTLIGAHLHDFLRVSGREWSSDKFVDALPFFFFCPRPGGCRMSVWQCRYANARWAKSDMRQEADRTKGE